MRNSTIDALCAIIATATGVKQATRDTQRDLISATRIPCVIVSDNGREDIQYKTGGRADVYVTLDLEILTNAGKNQSAALNALDVAIKAKLLQNPTLSGAVAHVTVMPQVGGDTTGGDGIASRTRQVRIFYDCDVNGGM